jgi:hypothetical protein
MEEVKEMLLDLYDEVEYRVRQAFAASRRRLSKGVPQAAALTVAAGIVLWGWRAARKLRRIPDEQQWEQALAQALDVGHGQVAAVLTNDASSKWVPPSHHVSAAAAPLLLPVFASSPAALKNPTPPAQLPRC